MREPIDFSRNPKQGAYFGEVMRSVSGSSGVRFFAYGGAVRGGKTFVTLFSLIMLARKFPGSRWHVVRRDLPALRQTTIPSFEKIAPPSVRIHRDPGNYHAEFPNGSKIFFKAESKTQDPELRDWLGLETNGIFIEQAEEISEAMWNRAKERTGSWYIKPMPPGLIFLTFNPCDGWVRKTFYEPHTRQNLAPPYYYMNALPRDNAFVTDDQWATWRTMDDISYKMFIEGDWDAKRTDNAFYWAFSRARHVGPVAFDPALPVHLSFDQNVLPYNTLTCWQVRYAPDGTATLQQFDEFCLTYPGNDTEAVCGAFLAKYGAMVKQAYLYGDASGHKRDTRGRETDYSIAKRALRQMLNNSSDRTLRSNPDVLQRREWLNNVLSEKYPIRLIIGDNCANTLNDLQMTQTDANGHKLKKKVSKDGATFEEVGHTGDTLDYCATTIFRREFDHYRNLRFGLNVNVQV